MTITISEDVAPSTIDRLPQYLQREKVSFAIQESEQDVVKVAAISERLRLKYVVTGQWATMNDEDRQDAALLEGMLHDDENANVELLSADEQISFRNEMKSWAK